MKENFPNLAKEIDMKSRKHRESQTRWMQRGPRHIIIKMPKVKEKEKTLKAAREKHTVTYKGVPIRLSADFSKETLQARGDWQEIFKVMENRDLQPRLLYPAMVSFTIEGHIKSFPDKKQLKELIITKPLLYEMLKGLI